MAKSIKAAIVATFVVITGGAALAYYGIGSSVAAGSLAYSFAYSTIAASYLSNYYFY